MIQMSTRWMIAGMSAWASFCCHADGVPTALTLAQSELRQRLQDEYPDVISWTLTPMLSDRQMTALARDAEIHVDSTKLGRRSAVQVSWREGGQRRRQPVWFDVSGQRPAWLMSIDVKRNAPIEPAALRAEAAAEWNPGCSAVPPAVPVEGVRARKALRAGDVLCAEDMEPKPPVSRGERVVVLSRAGLVTVSLSGIAEQDGKVGERLQVRNPDSGESFTALVSAEGEVSVRQ